MSEFSIIALDLAKNLFQMHGADASGTVLFRKKLRRDQILKCLAAQPTCTVATRLCGMAGAYPAAALHRRQAEARQDVTYGRTNPATTTDHRRERGRALGNAQRLDSGFLACAHACPQAAHAGDRRPR